MLSVEPVRNAADVFHELERPIGVLFGSCGEYDDLEVGGHQLQERVGTRSNGQLAFVVVELLEKNINIINDLIVTYLFEVEKCLVEIQDKRVLALAIKCIQRRQIGRLDESVALVHLHAK